MTFLQVLDGLATSLPAPLFVNRGLERWLRVVAIANGIVAVPVFLSFIYLNVLLGIWGSITLPAFTLLLLLYFWDAK